MNTESADESALRTALQDAVPPLREPADRVAEVGARVRRYRARTVAAAAMAVAVVLAGAGALALARPHHRPGLAATGAGDDCPPADVAEPTRASPDTPGAIVPSGAIRATLCERKSKDFPSPFEIDYSPRMLTQKVDELVSLANSLPDPSTKRNICFPVGYLTEISFVFGYADRPPLVVWVDRNCGALFTAERTRYFLRYKELPDAFYQLYRAQLRATTPVATIPTPTCPITHDPRVDTAATRPSDGIGRNRGFAEPLLPDPLAAMAACRYELAGDSWVLARQEQRRSELESTRLILNNTYAKRDHADCLDTNKNAMRPTLVDSVWVADTTGAVSEARVWRRPCATFHTGYSVLRPIAALLTYLDGTLGTPP
jgi:hypothetical protein